MRKVYKYDLHGNFIKSYDNATIAAVDLHCDESTIRKAANKGNVAKGFLWKTDVEEIVSHKTKSFPKILIFDIETAPMKAFIWRMFKENISIDQMTNDWFVLSWSAKWLFDKNIMSARITGKQAKKEDDSSIITGLWSLLDEADIVIAHNSVSFDVPKSNARFVYHDMAPPSPYKQIDTLKIAQRQFGFSSNKLDAIAKFFGIGEKIKTNFDLWKDCVEGSDRALKEMEIYNRMDVDILEKVYLKIRPWIKGHPNIGLYLESDGEVCANCGSSVAEMQDKYYYTTSGKYNLYRCTSSDCGAISRARNTIYDKEKRSSLIVSIGR